MLVCSAGKRNGPGQGSRHLKATPSDYIQRANVGQLLSDVPLLITSIRFWLLASVQHVLTRTLAAQELLGSLATWTTPWQIIDR
jgi:hypothetical protein